MKHQIDNNNKSTEWDVRKLYYDTIPKIITFEYKASRLQYF